MYKGYSPCLVTSQEAGQRVTYRVVGRNSLKDQYANKFDTCDDVAYFCQITPNFRRAFQKFGDARLERHAPKTSEWIKTDASPRIFGARLSLNSGHRRKPSQPGHLMHRSNQDAVTRSPRGPHVLFD
jgi:hypothetical protein